MKKIVLLSDTHSYIDEAILQHVQWADEVWHAGDIGAFRVTDAITKYKPLKAVYGNIDDHKMRATYPETLLFYCEEVKVFMIHIGGYPDKYKAVVKTILQQEQPQLYICGHSHILKVQYDKKLEVLHMNPGAVGISGFHTVRTLLRFEIEGKDIKNLVVVELTSK